MGESWRERMRRVPCLVPDFQLSPGTTALVIIDVQRCFADPGMGISALLLEKYPEAGRYYTTRLRDTVVPNTSRLLGEFRRRSLRVVHITVGPELLDGSDFSPLRRQANENAEPRFRAIFPNGAPEHRIIDELAPVAGELCLNKTTRSAFNSTSLELTLRNLGVDGLILCGVQTNACVESTARDAADFGFKCVVVSDACQCFDPDAHDASLAAFASLFGKVWCTREVIDWLTAGFACPPEASG